MIIESGWIVEEVVMQDILTLCGIMQIYEKFLEFSEEDPYRDNCINQRDMLLL